MPEDEAEIIVCADNFHGRTIAIVGFSTDPEARGGFGPFCPASASCRSAMPRRSRPRSRRTRSPSWSSRSRARPASSSRRPATFASRELCTGHGVTLILDEIQTGLGRTGKLLAEEHEGIEADVTLLGKALSGGFYPVSAVLSNTEVLGVLKPGQHGSTFGGNPLACAVASAALKVLTEEGMIENSADGRLHQGRSRSRSHRCCARGARPRVDDGRRTPPGGGMARRYVEALSRAACDQGRARPTIRIAPPLVITREEADWAIERFEAALKAKPRTRRDAVADALHAATA